MKRRSFLSNAARTAALVGLGDLGFLRQLPVVAAADAQLPAAGVRFAPEIEPLVRLLEGTPRERVLEEVADRIRRGTSYRDILTALLLAGVRNIQPRPVGFKFHAVLVINSAHIASLASPDSDRWLPIFWAIDQFKNSQAADVREGDWTIGAIEESAIPPSHKVRAAFIEAMENWDDAAADAAVVGLVRHLGAHETFRLLSRYGARDFRDIGHKEIFVANSFRLLSVIGWQHAEPVLRSVTYALLDRAGDPANPAKADFAADRPWRHSLATVGQIRAGWQDGRPDAAATGEMLRVIRDGSSSDAGRTVVELLNRGVAPSSLFAAYFGGAGELLMRAPGILSLHATTFTNAMHYAWQHCDDDETRRLLLLQNAAFLPLFRGNSKDKGLHTDTLQSTPLTATGAEAVTSIFADLSRDRLGAARKILGYLEAGNDARVLTDAARRLVFLKGRDSHDYKFSSAVLEDYTSLPSPWRDRFLATAAFYFKGAGDADNVLVKRIRAAVPA